MKSSKNLFVVLLIGLLSFTSVLVLFPTAKAETWTNITFPYTITQSGNYNVTQPWSGSGVGLSVNASNVVVNGQNKLIELNQTEGDYAIVIAPGSSNVLLTNINETGADYGVYAEEGNFTTKDSMFTNNTSAGVFAFNITDFTIQHSRLSNNSYGLFTLRSSNFTMQDCHVKNNTEGIEAVYSNNFTIKDSYINNNSEALMADTCINFTVIGTTIENNEMGILAGYSGNFAVDNCSINNNEAFGLACILGNFTVANSCLKNNTIGVYGIICDYFTISNASLTNNLAGMFGIESNFTIRDSEVSYNAIYGMVIQLSNATVKRCNINNSTIGLVAQECGNFNLEHCNVFNNTEMGLEDYFGNNTLINSNSFSRNGLDVGSASGAFMAENSNCTVTNNVFTNNFDGVLLGIYDEELNNTQVYRNNAFLNNNFTLDFNYRLLGNFTNQQLYFSNNLVNDSAYVNPESFSQYDQYVPSSAVFHLNSTLQLGTRPYSNGPVIGGNFWAYPNGTGFSQTGTDANHDGFVDVPFELFGNATLGAAYDYHPYSLGFDINTWVPITLPETITQPGNYRITSSWSGNGTGLAVKASNVVVDGQNNLLKLAVGDNDFGVKINDCTNVLLKNINVANSTVAVYARKSSNFTVQDSTLSNNIVAGVYANGCDNFTVQNSTLQGSQEYSGMYVVDCSDFLVKGCSLNNNSVDGLTAQYVDHFTVINSTMKGNGWGTELFHSSNGTVRNCSMSYNSQSVYVGNVDNVNFTGNVFSYNGLASGAYTGGLETSDSNCTVTNNVFESNYDALIWSASDGNIAATSKVNDNIFHNNTYTFFFFNQLPSNYTNQKLFFYNNLVNDTAYVDPVCFDSSYSGNYLPLNSGILNLNITLQAGARIYSTGPMIGGNYWAYPNGTGYSQTAADANHDGFMDTAFDLFGNLSIGKTYDYLPYSQTYSPSLAFTAGASQTLAANQTSVQLTVQFKDSFGPITSGITVNLSSNSSTAKFYSDQAGTQQISIVTIPQGSSVGSFYFKDTTAGTPAINASAQGVISAATQFTINAHSSTVDHLTISPIEATIAAAKAINYTTTAYDQYGNAWNVTAAYSINDIPIEGNTVSIALPDTYIVTATFGDKTASTTLTVTVGALDHFVVLTETTATIGTPSSVMVIAVDVAGNTVTSFGGTVSLSVNQGTITPSTSFAFLSGVWIGKVSVTSTGSIVISVSDGNGHSGTSRTISVTSPTPTPAPKSSPTSTIQATTSSGTIVNLAINGNITTSQISGVTITTNQSSATTTISFTVTGQSGTTGFSNMTIPKSQVPYGTTPTVNIDGQPAQNQGFTQDDENYYVWYTTSFSTHQVQIQFIRQTTEPQTPTIWYALIVVVAVIAVAIALVVSKRKHAKPTVNSPLL